MELLENFKWRYATKVMNGKKVLEDKINNIIKAASLAPTSSGLQHEKYSFFYLFIMCSGR